jgi:hypothetical protein
MPADYALPWTSETIGYALIRWNLSNVIGAAFLVVWPLLRVIG